MLKIKNMNISRNLTPYASSRLACDYVVVVFIVKFSILPISSKVLKNCSISVKSQMKYGVLKRNDRVTITELQL